MILKSKFAAVAALAVISLVCVCAGPAQGAAAGPAWRHLSTATDDLPRPGASTQQNAALVADLDRDGFNDFVIGCRAKGPALVWYRRTEDGWKRYVIDKDTLPIEAGGACCDIDGDGWPDLVFGGDYTSNSLWWWRNPGKDWKPNVPWERHTIKKSGRTQHHGICFGDFKGTGRPQLAFWNQGDKKLFLAGLPENPRQLEEWPLEVVAADVTSPGTPYTEGLSAFDVDGDGRQELLGFNTLYKYLSPGRWSATKIADLGGLILAGRLIKDAKIPQIVIAPGDGQGPVKWYECQGNNPFAPGSWRGHDLAGRVMIRPHSLQLADIDKDGNLDIFVAEMAKWSEGRPDPDNPKAQAFIFYGDGKGEFRRTVFQSGMGFHEAQVADLNGDGLPDILDKPYNWQAPRLDVWLQQPTPPGATLGEAKTLEWRGDFKGPLGLALASLGAALERNVPATLAQVRRMGFREVEVSSFYGLTPQAFRRQLGKAGLRCTAYAADYDRLRGDLDRVTSETRILGASSVVCGWIPHQGAFTAAEAEKAAADFNQWGEKLKAAGLSFSYRLRGYEFQPQGAGTLFNILAQRTRPEFVSFQLDVFRALCAGQDPAKLMLAWPNRFLTLHLGDLRKGAKTGVPAAAVPGSASVAVGTGQADWPVILQQAEKIKIKRYYIADEAAAESAARQIPESVHALETLRYPKPPKKEETKEAPAKGTPKATGKSAGK